MNLTDTAQTVSNWIQSCTNAEQLDLCKDAVQNFITDRFREESAEQIAIDLNHEIKEKGKALQAIVWEKHNPWKGGEMDKAPAFGKTM